MKLLCRYCKNNVHYWSCFRAKSKLSRSGPNHVQVISYHTKLHLKSLGLDLELRADSIIAMSPTTTQETFPSEITQIYLQEVNCQTKGGFREAFEYGH